MMRVLSWGMGLQSTTLAVLSAKGALPRLDAVLATDPGWERRQTYETTNFYFDWLSHEGLHVEIIPTGDIRQDGAQNHIHMPFWTETGGPLNRQCTKNFKILPIRRRIRELLGYHPSQPPAPPPNATELWLGFSWEEVGRLKPSNVQFIVHRSPLIEMRWTRKHCTQYLESQGLPVPVKSSCVGCPFRTPAEWLEMKQISPDEWEEAVSFDNDNRNNPLAQQTNGKCTADQLYIYKHRRQPEPLATANLEAHARTQRPDQLYLDWCDGPCAT